MDFNTSTVGPGEGDVDGTEDEEGPTAPPAEMLEDLAGYEGTISLGDGNVVPPPALRLGNESEQHVPPLEWRIPTVTEDVARHALYQFAASRCCYQTSPSQDMVFQDLKPLNTYRYHLETFTEVRLPEWVHVPFTGQKVDSSDYGSPPLPWDIAVKAPPMFQNHTHKVPVPHTAGVKKCHKCRGRGKYKCAKCWGKGNIKCAPCRGHGIVRNKRCLPCHGTGVIRCGPCLGRGTRTCQVCKARGWLLFYIQLTVKWVNNAFEQIADQEVGLPVTLFSKVTGQNIFVDESYQVYPVLGFPDPLIDQASYKGVQEHQQRFAGKTRILQQRQTIELIPVTQVHFQWKGRTHDYFVYGTENKVYAPHYPAKCCCTIL
ncbi:protein SSUH2 homolog [Callorhinchus milii]|uniref:protein SSUH2 homolog n=1 Tax=Callorhinchus milii TaxID=7868 RepID=UPI001C3F6DC1|nr:protein SSUH2 homolog [Callorhinchus milii]